MNTTLKLFCALAIVSSALTARPAAADRAGDWGDATAGHYTNSWGLQATKVDGIMYVTHENGDVAPHPTAPTPYEPVKLKIDLNYVTVTSWVANNVNATFTTVSFSYQFGVHAGGNKAYKLKVYCSDGAGGGFWAETVTSLTRQCPH